jgi:tRNA G18 (ribose-2'-O)-methylase SpoU
VKSGLAENEGMRELVTDAEDPRLADYARLTDMELRTSLEPAQGLFIAEGAKVIGRAVAAGYPVRSVLLAERRLGDLPALLPQLAGTGAPVYVVPDQIAERLTGYRVHRGALASLHRKPLPPAAALAAAARRVIVLEDLVDHANVGAIFRCAAALGVDAVFLSPRCADPLYRRAVKVSMGAVFAIPYARMTGWYDGLAGLRAAGFRLLALTPDQMAAPISAAVAGQRTAQRTAERIVQRIALLLGTEGDGLSSRWRHEADQAVRIPMHPGALAAGVDSLNVVAAAAIACHVLVGADQARSGMKG